MSNRYDVKYVPYMRYDSANGGDIPSEYLKRIYDRVASNTQPLPDGSFVKPGHNTTSYYTTIKPLWRYGYGSRTTRQITNQKQLFSTDSIWNYSSGSNCYLRALNGVGDRKMTLGETLAESRGTFAMIAKNTTAIASMLKDLKRGNLRGAASTLGLSRRGLKNAPRDLSSKYLELIFGWAPLVDEVYNGIDVVQNGLNSNPDHYIVSSVSRANYTLTRTTSKSISQPEGVTVSNLRGHIKTTWKFTHPSYLRSMDQLGILNVPRLAWNLMPSSFLIDWFIPVDSWLGAFTATNGLSHLDTYSVNHATHVTTWTAESRYPLGGSCEYGLVQRRILNDTIPLPEPELPRSMQQAITATALLLSSTRRR